MDSISRLARLAVFFIVGLFLGGVSVLSFAQSQGTYPANKRWITESSDPNNYAAAVSACQGLAALIGETYYGTTGYYAGVTPPLYLDSYHYCSWRRYSTPTCPSGQYCGWNSGVKTKPEMFCLSGGVLSADKTTCNVTCPEGQQWNAELSQCQASCSAGSNAGYYSTGFLTTACINGCSYTRSASGNFSVCSGWSDETGWASCYLAQSGQTCSTPNGAPSSSQSQCPVGQCPGTINGVPTCQPCTGKTDTQSSGTKTTTNPDGSTTTTTTTTNTTSDGGSTTTTTTTNTTNTPAGGGTSTTTTTTDTETKPKDSFCIENPDSPLCKQSSFGGSCGSFSCDGDAIQCAMARHQHQKRCDDENAHTQNSFIAQAKSILEGGSDSVTDPIATPETRSLGSFDTSDMLTAGCPAPRSYTVLGAAMTINYQPFCDIAAIVKIFLVVGALLLGGRIVVGGI